MDAHFGNFTIPTDQPPQASAPTPFATFLSTIGTCAGIYVLGFCQQRGVSPEGIKIIQRDSRNPMSGMVENIDLEILLPADFPEKYKEAVIRAADLCAVKKHLEQPPKINVTAKIG